HSTSARSATDDRPDTIPPPPRRPVSFPSSLSLNEIGPRLEATSTRPHASASMPVRLARSGPGSGRRERLECGRQLHKGHPEGWRERPCEAPATTTVTCPRRQPAAAGRRQRGLGPWQVPTPARGPGGRRER